MKINYTADVLLAKWRQSATQVSQLTKDNALLFSLLEQLVHRLLPEQKATIREAKKWVDPVANYFGLTDSEKQSLRHMVQLSFLGRAIGGEKENADPLVIEQLEWLLRESPNLSVLGTAMTLSLERHDGTGELGLESDSIPDISKSFRTVMEIAYETVVDQEEVVLRDKLASRLEPYLTHATLETLLDELQFNEKENIEWIETSQLQPGMQVMDDVRNEEGLLLIAGFTTLTENLIRQLESYDETQSAHHLIPVLGAQPEIGTEESLS